MRERPILFSVPMVRAILAGHKTQTRRVAKKPVRHPDLGNLYAPGALVLEREPQHVIERACPYGGPGDRLWVRETWTGPLVSVERWETVESPSEIEKPEFCEYAADGGPTPEWRDSDDILRCRWTPSIHMPRWASRITLEITGVRVERLQDISPADCVEEGYVSPKGTRYAQEELNALDWYRDLWESINGRGSWEANPWVWVVEFRRT